MTTTPQRAVSSITSMLYDGEILIKMETFPCMVNSMDKTRSCIGSSALICCTFHIKLHKIHRHAHSHSLSHTHTHANSLTQSQKHIHRAAFKEQRTQSQYCLFLSSCPSPWSSTLNAEMFVLCPVLPHNIVL